MRKVIIYKDKITSTDWNSETQEWLEQDVKKSEEPLVKYFNRLVEIRPDVTIYDFMKHLEAYESSIDYCFQDYSKGVPLRLFLNEMEKEPTDSSIEDVEMFWEGEIVQGDLAIFGYLRGWLKEEKLAEFGLEYEIPQDVTFTPINNWKNCRLILNEGIAIVNMGTMEEIKKELFFAGFYRWTLFELISNFITELTLNGSPAERDKLLVELESRKYDVKEVVKDKDKCDFWTLFLSSEIADMKLMLESAMENEEYEKITSIKESIESTEKELETLKAEIAKYHEKRNK